MTSRIHGNVGRRTGTSSRPRGMKPGHEKGDMTAPRRSSLALLTAFTMMSLGPGMRPSQAEDRASSIFRDARAYTVRIRTQITTPFLEDERGSFSGAGFLVDAARGWVVTNAHVVSHSPSEVTVAFADGTFHPARKVYVDSFTDMAVLEVPVDSPQHPVAPIDCDGAIEVGEAIGAFGHPLGMPFTGTRGIVSGKTDQFLNDFLQIDATVDHGNSGGPVIALRDARVVGIATAGIGSKAERLNFATPMRDVCRILELLRKGIPPEAPELQFSLLMNEDGRHTLQVGTTFDAARWPFLPGDRVIAVGQEREKVATVTQLVSAMRGRIGTVPLLVSREGREVEVTTHPALRGSVIARQAVSIDGALIAPNAFEDMQALSEPARLIVHSVEPSSTAQTLGMGAMDVIESIDGRRIDDVAALIGYLHLDRKGAPLRVIFRRLSTNTNCWFDYHVRELPGQDVTVVGPDAQLVSSAR